jgi:hypothetical protein
MAWEASCSAQEIMVVEAIPVVQVEELRHLDAVDTKVEDGVELPNQQGA